MRVFFFLLALPLFSQIEKHFKPVAPKIEIHSIQNVELIYLINLDTRPEKLLDSLQQLARFGIVPQRFAAIYGWHLPLDCYPDLGVKFAPGMWKGIENALYISPEGYFHFVGLCEEFYDKTVFSSWLTPGAIGCTLSHLSVLQDAYDAGYNTIWVLEDDFTVAKDPHVLSEVIEKLDTLVGNEGWDILYTDPDYLFGVDLDRDLQEQLPYKWRPDMPQFDLKMLFEHTPIGDDFFKIGNRLRTHSMIIRRSGIQKILQFYKERHIFLPYDHELGFIPHIRLYVTKESIVNGKEISSDTKNKYF